MRQLERIRRDRVWRDHTSSLADEAGKLKKQIDQTSKRLGDIITAWDEVIPRQLSQQTRIDGLRGSVLRVVVEDSATSFALDRFLREGGQTTLRQAANRPIARVKIMIGTVIEREQRQRKS